MNDADLDIILGITNGRLTGQQKQDALDLIAADPELSEELAIQVSAMDELGALEPAHMTPSEKLALRNSLVEQLHLEPGVPAVPVIRTSTQKRPWWQFALASAAALLVAIVVVPSMLSGSDNSSSDFVAIAPEVTETVESDVNSGDTDTETKTETTSAAAAAEMATASTITLPHITEDGVQEFFAELSAPTDAESTAIADDAASGSEDVTDETIAPPASTFSDSDEITVNLVRIEECLTELALDLPGGEHIPMAATLDNGVTTIHFGVASGSDIAYSVSIELENCTITSTAP